MTAVIVEDEKDAALRSTLDHINTSLGRDPKTVLHWADNIKTHSQRKFVADVIGSSECTLTSVTVLKASMYGRPTMLSDSTYQYNYAIRRLMERISWFVDERNGEAIITFAHVRRFPYDKLDDYMETLRLLRTEIRWPAIRKYGINNPDNIRLLQFADIAVGSLTAAVRADEFGSHEPRYLMALAPRVYVRGKSKVTSYGFNVIGDLARLKEYDWWEAFRKACEER